MSMLVSWLVLSAAVWVTALIVPGFRLREGVGNAILVAALFGVLNATLGFVLFHMIGIGTLFIGYLLAFATRLFVTAVVLKVVDAMTDRLTIDSFPMALAAGLSMSLLGTVAEWLIR